jgi:beta-glucanase (GH16 family)
MDHNARVRPRAADRTRSPRWRSALTAMVLLAGFVVGTVTMTVAGAPAARASTVPPAPPGWTTVFSDDFAGSAGSAPSSANWFYDIGSGYGTGETEHTTNSTDNVYLDGNGHLVLKAVNNGGAWTSARIESTRDDFQAPAGGQLEMTASIEQPNPASGLGYWPAFWAMGAAARPVGATNWPSIGELDIMEDVNALSEVSHTFHCGVDPGGPCNETTGIGSGLQACGGCQTGYHTYSVIVDRTTPGAEQLRFYTDGNLQLTVNQSQFDATTWANAVDHPFFIIFDLAMGGGFPAAFGGGPNAATASGHAMKIDYVAVYQK